MNRQINFGSINTINYRNHRGEVNIRSFIPLKLFYGWNQWHPQEQWLVEVWDCAKGPRTYALSGFLDT